MFARELEDWKQSSPARDIIENESKALVEGMKQLTGQNMDTHSSTRMALHRRMCCEDELSIIHMYQDSDRAQSVNRWTSNLGLTIQEIHIPWDSATVEARGKTTLLYLRAVRDCGDVMTGGDGDDLYTQMSEDRGRRSR